MALPSFLPSQSSDYPPAPLAIECASILFSPEAGGEAYFQLDGTVGYSNILVNTSDVIIFLTSPTILHLTADWLILSLYNAITDTVILCSCADNYNSPNGKCQEVCGLFDFFTPAPA